MDLSIIIVSYNTRDITQRCIESVIDSLQKSKLTYEIIVVDNKSTDDSVRMLLEMNKKHDALIELIINNENKGFGQANNQAAKKAKGRYLLLLNSDTIILENAIEKTYHFINTSEYENSFVGVKLLNKDHSIQPSAAPFFSLPVIFAFLFLKGDRIGLTRRSPEEVEKVGWVAGAFIMVKKDIFNKVGGFDEDIFMYMEEVDLLYRAKKMGFPTYFYPNTQVIHLGSASSNRTYPILQVYQGLLYFYRKNRGKLATQLVKFMLKYKAVVSILLGKIFRSSYLVKTYEQALEVVKKN